MILEQFEAYYHWSQLLFEGKLAQTKTMKMKKTIFLFFVATSLFACKASNDQNAINAGTKTNTSSCVKEGPEVDLMKKAITAYSNGDWATMATCFSDTAKSWHNSDSVAMTMSDRIEMFKQQRASLESVDAGTPNLEVVTVDTDDERYKGYKWGHAWVTFTTKSKTGAVSKTVTFASFAIKDEKIVWEQVIYDAK